jgi:hypothetical protein
MAREKVRETESAVQEPDIWQVLLRDVEAKLDSLSQELADLKTAVGRLSAMPSPSAAPTYEETLAPEIAPPSPEPETDTAVLASKLATFEPEKSWTETEMPAFTGLGSLGNSSFKDAVAPAPDDDEASREEVRHAVEALRDEIGSAAVDEVETAEPPEEDEATRDEVRRAVEAMREEMTVGATSDDAIAPAPEEAEDPSRDEVRRAVEAMRAEMADEAGDVEEPDAPAEPLRRGPSLTEMFASHESPVPLPGGPAEAESEEGSAAERWQARHDESTTTPLAIVIEDPQGRVELSRVYDALSRVDCAANAALLNYTPHSVTVGLSPRSTLPQPDALVEAVAGVFGVPCRVSSDGLRLTVQLGEDAEKGAA